MKIITWNVNSINVRQDQLKEMIVDRQPYIVGLQELKCETQEFPFEMVENLGYYAVVNGQKTYNGVALISKEKPADVKFDLPSFEDEQKRVIAATYGNVRVINAYIPNGQEVGSDKYEYKLNWLKAFHEYVQQALKEYENLIVMGDFNIVPTDSDLYAPDLWGGKILCSDEERKVFNGLLELGLSDALRIYSTNDPLYTWWDYRQGRFEKDEGMRIDHHLLSKDVASRLIRVEVLKHIRAQDRPSDHAPVAIYLQD